MDSIYCAARVRVDGVYIGQTEETSFTVMSNGEQLISAEQIKESTGKVTVEANIKTIVADDGSPVNVTRLVIQQKNATIEFETDGCVFTAPGRFNRNQYSSNEKTGVVKGDGNFRGGPVTEVAL